MDSYTKTEYKVLELFRQDPYQSNQDLANELGVSGTTVSTHFRNIFKKAGVSGRNARFKLLKQTPSKK